MCFKMRFETRICSFNSLGLPLKFSCLRAATPPASYSRKYVTNVVLLLIRHNRRYVLIETDLDSSDTTPPSSVVREDQVVITLVFKRSDIAFAELYIDHDTSGLPMNYLNFTMTVQLVQVGTAWSIGLRSTIGRTLEKMGACAVRVDPVRLEAAIAMLLPSLKNEIGALNQLDETTLRRFLLGLLHHLRQRGGILHSATQSYIEQNGQSLRIAKTAVHARIWP